MTESGSKIFDVIIIGGGAAGMAAAVWCDELGLEALLLESSGELGGQLLWTYNAIKNYLGVETKNGREMRDIFLQQTLSRKFLLKTEAEVIDVNTEDKIVYLSSGESFSANAIVIATGIRRRKLGIENEDDFPGHGIIESGARDTHLIAGKRVCVVGGGDAALENALILSEMASEVSLIHRGENFRARKEFIDRVFADSKIRVLMNTIVSKIIGSGKIEALEVKNSATEAAEIIEADALLLRLGVEPNTDLFQGKLTVDDHKYIKINNECETSQKNIFAVGDVANRFSPTISSAVGMGTTAIKVIRQRLNTSTTDS